MALADSTCRTTTREWLLSMLGHGLVLGLILWLTPLHDVILPATTTKASPADAAKAAASQLPPPSPEQVKQVIQSIAEKQTENAKATVAAMLHSEKKVDGLVHTRLDALKQQTSEITAAAPQAALERLKAVVQNQSAAAQAQQKLADQLAAMAAKIQAAQASSDPAALPKAADDLAQLQKALAQAQEDAKTNQLAAQDGQDKATHLLKFVESKYAESSAAQAAADTAQETATESQRQAIDHANHEVESLEKYFATVLQGQQAQDQVPQSQAALTQLQAQKAQQQQAVAAQSAQVRAVNQALKTARNLARQSNNPADLAAVQSAEAAVQTAQAALADARQKANQTQQAINKAQNEARKAQDRIARGNQEADKALAAMSDPAAIAASQQKAAQDQAAAAQAQNDALAKLNAAVAPAPNAAVAGTTPAAPAPAAAAAASEPGLPITPAPDISTLEGKNLAQLYDAARNTENRVTDKYKVFRAAELASIQKITMAEAMKETEVARPHREEINTALLASNGGNTDLAAYKAEVIKANGQLASMISLSSQMLAEMQGQAQESGSGTIDVSNWLKAQSESYEQQKSLATASDDNVVGKDLTGLMKGGGTGGGGGDNSNEKIPPDPRALLSYPRNAPELPVMDLKNLKPYATRRITSDGLTHADWVYIDSWYLIGPFPNEGRRNLYTHFPPESIVDLNASYIGKYNTPIHWQYLQWNGPRIRMPHDVEDAPAIYYAYTELYFDQPRDLWIATGSDDKGSIWLNDILVWNSGDEFKAWEPNEGYRKVHFQQGVNRILYRLENGQLAAALSFMISLKP